jgi:phosphatidylglycerol:prolipoprotein diacylglycerol transferase
VRSTLFLIPAELFGVPVFGLGWLLAVWLLASLTILALLVRRQGWNRETAGYVPFLLIVAAVIAFVMPMIVERDATGQPLGIPIRGFGVMFMVATVAGVGLAAYRAWQMGINPEVMYSLAFTMFVAGLIGARLFYVAQNWTEFDKPTTGETIRALLNFTSGGLVVYGSVIAGLPAGIWFLRRRGMPILPMADIIAPSMMVGQAIGRLGCFLNGCCYGGVCLTAPWAMTFPGPAPTPPHHASPPYQQHVQSGWHSGVWLGEQEGEVRVAYVAPGSPPVQAGVRAGQLPVRINGAAFESLAQARGLLLEGRGSYEIETADGSVHRWTIRGGPARSVPIHPTQIYSAIDAALLGLVLWFYFPFRRRDGEVFAILITAHPISRFVLEVIRNDEPGQFGTALTISQWLGLGILAVACVLWLYIERQPRLGSAGASPSQPLTSDL